MSSSLQAFLKLQREENLDNQLGELFKCLVRLKHTQNPCLSLN